MKKLCHILLLLPFIGLSQYDFEKRYFTIDATSLPTMPSEYSLNLDFDSAPKFQKKSIQDFFKVTVENYYQPVSMSDAYSETLEYQNNAIDVDRLRAQYNTTLGTVSYGADGATKVKNTVYKEQRGLDYLNTCPPFGICSRCAPYRVGRGY